MTAKTATTTDPLAGIPTATAKPVRPAAAPATNVVNLAEAKRKRKLTSTEYKAARDFARGATGYDSTSPIWGKQMPEVLMAIEEAFVNAIAEVTAGNSIHGLELLEAGLLLNRELQKRIATGKLISAQTK